MIFVSWKSKSIFPGFRGVAGRSQIDAVCNLPGGGQGGADRVDGVLCWYELNVIQFKICGNVVADEEKRRSSLAGDLICGQSEFKEVAPPECIRNNPVSYIPFLSDDQRDEIFFCTSSRQTYPVANSCFCGKGGGDACIQMFGVRGFPLYTEHLPPIRRRRGGNTADGCVKQAVGDRPVGRYTIGLNSFKRRVVQQVFRGIRWNCTDCGSAGQKNSKMDNR